jgi:PIN domain nuclease of toxin-antitoxin system
LTTVEIALLVSRGRLQITQQDLKRGMDDLCIRPISFDHRHASRYFSLPENATHRDPFDRMLIAQALEEGLPIVTSDRRFSTYPGLDVIW